MTNVTTRATGSFDVKITPLASDTPLEGSPLGRMSIEKQFHADLEGTSKGEMLTAGTAMKNSARHRHHRRQALLHVRVFPLPGLMSR
jgi:uncharacterized protein DUF3224